MSRYTLAPLDLPEQWDAFVSAHSHGHLLQGWSWGEIKASAQWHPLRLALWDREQQQIVAAAQVLRRTVSHVPLRAGHLAYIPRGPVIDWMQPSLCEEFFFQLNGLLQRQGALALHLELGQESGVAESTLILKRLEALHAHPVHAVQPLRTIMLDITPDEATLLAQMKEKWRYNVRLAARKGVTVRTAQTPEDVQAWYGLLQTTAERDQFGIHTLDYYLKAWRISAPRNEMQLLLAEHDKLLLAGIFVAFFARQAIYLYGASSNEQRQLMPNYLLQWEAIRLAKRQGAACYDFWGIPDTEAEDEHMAGVYRFKRGWGGRVAQFMGCYELAYRPLLMKIANKFI
jgi:lipid II:glycine glycyltransferase (peptidoglycan interpeptide bridge formation enzyme)